MAQAFGEAVLKLSFLGQNQNEVYIQFIGRKDIRI